MKLDILDCVKNALAKTLNLNTTESIQHESKLKEDLGLDSMSSLTFLMMLEDSIEGFFVDPESLQLEHLSSVSSITEYVQQQRLQVV